MGSKIYYFISIMCFLDNLGYLKFYLKCVIIVSISNDSYLKVQIRITKNYELKSLQTLL